MRAGLLQEDIEILKSTTVTNKYGEQSSIWTVIATTKARLIHDSGARTEINNEIFYAYTKTFQVRYYVNVSEFDRIRWNNQLFRIISIEPNKQQQSLTIKTELVND